MAPKPGVETTSVCTVWNWPLIIRSRSNVHGPWKCTGSQWIVAAPEYVPASFGTHSVFPLHVGTGAGPRPPLRASSAIASDVSIASTEASAFEA